MKNISKKDNPVPSIDLEHYRKFLIKRGFVNDGPIMYAHFSPLKAYLKKYGVENYNEQPKCKNCGDTLEQIDDICDECGYDQGF